MAGFLEGEPVPKEKAPRGGAWIGAGNGIRTHDFNLGKVALYH